MNGLDRSDPAVRAALRLERSRRREASTRTALCLTLLCLAVTTPIAIASATGAGESAIGAVAFSVACIAAAIALWPEAWSAREREHRELESVWRELRTDADRQVPWDRYGTWAITNGETVELLMVHCAPAADRVAGAPSPFDARPVRRVTGTEAEAATVAMEELRAEAACREQEAERRYEQRIEAAARATDEARLRQIDLQAAAAIRAGEERARQEAAAQEAAENRAQAEALARSLRRP